MQRLAGQTERWNLPPSVPNPLHLVCNTYVNAVITECGRIAMQLGCKWSIWFANLSLATAAGLMVAI
jgi:hypothetical protein